MLQQGETKGLEGGAHQTIQREEQHWSPPFLCRPLAPSSPLPKPLNASSLESTAALAASWSTPNLWPATPVLHSIHHRAVSSVRSVGRRWRGWREGGREGGTSCEPSSWRPRGATAVATGVNSEYRCYRCSSHTRRPHPSLQIQITEILEERVVLRGCVCVCMSRSHLCWCSWVKDGILLFLDGELPATQWSGYKGATLSSLLKKHVSTLCSDVNRWNVLTSPLFIFGDKKSTKTLTIYKKNSIEITHYFLFSFLFLQP